jgi:flagellar hook-associated protein 3 FlgL
MRITHNMIFNRLTADIQDAAGRVFRQQRQIATAKRISTPSDDPVGASLAISLKASLDELQQARRNGAEAEARLQASSDALDNILSAIGSVRDLALRGSADTGGPQDRQSLADEVNHHLEQVLAEANARSIDGYLFGGTQTTVAPFTATRDSDGLIVAVSANPLGIDGRVTAQLAGGATMTTNVSGSDVFSKSVDLFQLLVQVRDQLKTGSASDVAATLGSLDQALDQVRAASSGVGSRIARIRQVQQEAENALLTLKARLSETEDADLAEVSIQFQQAQTVYQAALATASRVLGRSLLDFLQ